MNRDPWVNPTSELVTMPVTRSLRVLFTFAVVMSVAVIAWRVVVLLRHDAYFLGDAAFASRWIKNEPADAMERMRSEIQKHTGESPPQRASSSPPAVYLSGVLNRDDKTTMAMALRLISSVYQFISDQGDQLQELCKTGRAQEPDNGLYDATEASAIAVSSYLRREDLHLQSSTWLICGLMRSRFSDPETSTQQAVRALGLLKRAVAAPRYLDHTDVRMDEAVRGYHTGWMPQDQRLIRDFLSTDTVHSPIPRVTQGVLLAWAVTHPEHPEAPDTVPTLLRWLQRRSEAAYDLAQLQSVYGDGADLKLAVDALLRHGQTGVLERRLKTLQTALAPMQAASIRSETDGFQHGILRFVEVTLPTPPYASLTDRVAEPYRSRMIALIESERYLISVFLLFALFVLIWLIRYRAALGIRGFDCTVVTRRVWGDLLLVVGGYWAFSRWVYVHQAQHAPDYFIVIHIIMPIALLACMLSIVSVARKCDLECPTSVWDCLTDAPQEDALSEDNMDGDEWTDEVNDPDDSDDNAMQPTQSASPSPSNWMTRALISSVVLGSIVNWVLFWKGAPGFHVGVLGIVSAFGAVWKPSLRHQVPVCALGNGFACLVVLCGFWLAITAEQLHMISQDTQLYSARPGVSVTIDRLRMDACKHSVEPAVRRALASLPHAAQGD